MTPHAIVPIPKDAQAVTYAANQPEYRPLPALKFEDGCVITQWQLTWRERLRVLFGSGIYVSKLTFNGPLQPMKLGVSFEEVQ